MTKIEEVRKEAQKLFHGMMKMLETDNVTSELFKVYQELRNKKDIFNELAKKYINNLKIIKTSMNTRHNLIHDIENILPNFLKERIGKSEDQSRISILKQINDACNSFNECYGNIQKGTHLYTQLQVDIGKFMGTIDDFVMSRKLEKEELLIHVKTKKT